MKRMARIKGIPLIAFCLLVLAGFLVNACSSSPTTLSNNSLQFIEESEQLTNSGSREIWQGQEYVRINIAELMSITRRIQSGKESPEKLNQPYVIRGYVYQDKKLTANGEFCVFRVQMVCCDDDATALGLRVRGVENDLADGQWIKIYGKLEKSAPLEVEIEPGRYQSYVNSDWIFIPEGVKRINTPTTDDSFIYTQSSDEPFFY